MPNAFQRLQTAYQRSRKARGNFRNKRRLPHPRALGPARRTITRNVIKIIGPPAVKWARVLAGAVFRYSP